MAEHKLGHGDCPACQEDTNRSMLELVALRDKIARLEAANIVKDVALKEIKEAAQAAQQENGVYAAINTAWLKTTIDAALSNASEAIDARR